MGREKLWLITCLVATLAAAAGSPTPSSSTYRAAVVQCTGRGNHSDPPLRNLQLVETLILQFVQTAANRGAQIVVLPEALGWGNGIDWSNHTLGRSQAVTYSVEGQLMGSEPCTDRNLLNGSWWHSASCAAKRSGIVVVLNSLHREPCVPAEKGCPEDGWHVYNTEAAFREDGAVIGMYHKMHIWGTSPILNEPSVADPTTFTTSFGVTFGMLVCYDIEFTDWLKPLLAKGVRHFVFSTNWEVNPPPLFAIHMLQQGFSRAHHSVLLAANMDTPGGSGSGIYDSGEVLAVYFNTSNEAAGISDDKMLIADVPKVTPEPPIDSVLTGPQLVMPMDDVGVHCQYEENFTGNPTFWGGNATDVNFGRCVFAAEEPGKQTLVAVQGPVRCEADVLVTPSPSSSTSSLTLFAASDSFSVLSTPDAEAIQACAMFLCKQTNSTSQEVVCDTLWSAASNDGSVQLIELRGSFSPNGTVIPMAAVDEMELLQPSKTPFYMHPQPTLRVELDESQKLYSAALYTQYQ